MADVNRRPLSLPSLNVAPAARARVEALAVENVGIGNEWAESPGRPCLARQEGGGAGGIQEGPVPRGAMRDLVNCQLRFHHHVFTRSSHHTKARIAPAPRRRRRPLQVRRGERGEAPPAGRQAGGAQRPSYRTN